MSIELLIFGMMLVTFIPRYLPFALAGRIKLPARVKSALDFVPIAVLTAIIVQVTLVRDGIVELSLTNFHLPAVLSAAVIAHFTRHLFGAIGVGLFVYAALRIFIGG